MKHTKPGLLLQYFNYMLPKLVLAGCFVLFFIVKEYFYIAASNFT